MKYLNSFLLFIAVFAISFLSCAEEQNDTFELEGIDYEIIALDENQPNYRTDEPEYDPSTDPAFICYKGQIYLDKNCNGKTDGIVNYFSFNVWHCFTKKQIVINSIESQGWCYEEVNPSCYQAYCPH